MQVDERSTVTLSDCEIEQILQEIENDPSGLGVKVVDFLKKIVYFDLLYGVQEDLCCLVIAQCKSSSVSNTINYEEEGKQVLKILQEHQLIYEKPKKNSNRGRSFTLLPSLQEKLLIENRKNYSVIVELITALQKIWIDNFSWHHSTSHVFHIHKSLKHLNWPDDTIKWSVYFGVQLVIDDYDQQMGLEMVDDVAAYLTTVNTLKALNEANWIAIQVIRMYVDNIMKSRKLLQPSDIISVRFIDGTIQDIRLDNYGSWILKQIRYFTDSKVDCDAIILVGVATLDRLQKHARVYECLNFKFL